MATDGVAIKRNTYLFKGQPQDCDKISSGWVTENYKMAMIYSKKICCYVTKKSPNYF